jgi:uncharacterized linocin/CFP29 family protein
VHDAAQSTNPVGSAAVTLARRAAQFLALAQDMVIFQGSNGYAAPFFSQNVRSGADDEPLNGGLLSLTGGPYASPNTPIQVDPLPDGSGVTYGENTLAAVTQGISTLTAQGNPGPYALVLNTTPYADLYAPVDSGSLVITADRVTSLVTSGIYGTGTVPPNGGLPGSGPSSPACPPYYGVLVSVGGDTLDVVIGLGATAEFVQQDVNGLWRFRVLKRFALRLKDPSAIQVLEFN